MHLNLPQSVKYLEEKGWKTTGSHISKICSERGYLKYAPDGVHIQIDTSDLDKLLSERKAIGYMPAGWITVKDFMENSGVEVVRSTIYSWCETRIFLVENSDRVLKRSCMRISDAERIKHEYTAELERKLVKAKGGKI